MTTAHKDSFFATDRRTWVKLCDSGMNLAVAYLVSWCGKGRDYQLPGLLSCLLLLQATQTS
jgi:hypothetical protein